MIWTRRSVASLWPAFAALFCAAVSIAPAHAGTSASADTFQVLVGSARYTSNAAMTTMQPAINWGGRKSPPLSSFKDGGKWLQDLLRAYVTAYGSAQRKAGRPRTGDCGEFCDTVVLANTRDGMGISFHGTVDRGYATFDVPKGTERPPIPGDLEDVRTLATLVATIRASPGITQQRLQDAAAPYLKPSLLMYRGPTGAARLPIPPPPPPPAPPPGWQPLRYAGPRPVPQYPGLAFLEGSSGMVVVRVSVQADGAVADAVVDVSSGHPALDEAALRAVRKAQFNTLDRSSPAHDRTTRIPFRFSLGQALDSRVVLLGAQEAGGSKRHGRALEWPAGYLHSRYQRAAIPMRFSDALATVRALAHAAPPVSGGPHLYAEFVETAAVGNTPTAIWFALDPGKPYGMIVRYAFSGAPAHPVVTVAAACPAGPSTCARAMPALLHGPFFARAATDAAVTAQGH